jgi:hypothetical protein
MEAVKLVPDLGIPTTITFFFVLMINRQDSLGIESVCVLAN